MNETTDNGQTIAPEPTGSRRRLLRTWLWGGVGVAALVEFGWLLRTLFWRRRLADTGVLEPEPIIAGAVDQFAAGQVEAIVRGRFYLSRLEDGSFLALSRTCTHLGCSLSWDETRQALVCPCHGSSFNRRGEVLSPPAIRPLDYYPVRIEDGMISVDIAQPLRREGFDESQTVRLSDDP